MHFSFISSCKHRMTLKFHSESWTSNRADCTDAKYQQKHQISLPLRAKDGWKSFVSYHFDVVIIIILVRFWMHYTCAVCSVHAYYAHGTWAQCQCELCEGHVCVCVNQIWFRKNPCIEPNMKSKCSIHVMTCDLHCRFTERGTSDNWWANGISNRWHIKHQLHIGKIASILNDTVVY